ncbi:MAG: hypothetical protein CM1200mP40_09890 [Gammaproteobacteria bacterium]|nr:MAG: hypothetical protein CM1200mP40_09890 [Gammaproteobacteria bacterium]
MNAASLEIFYPETGRTEALVKFLIGVRPGTIVIFMSQMLLH